jgi:hypothetical protein
MMIYVLSMVPCGFLHLRMVHAESLNTSLKESEVFTMMKTCNCTVSKLKFFSTWHAIISRITDMS